jgi:hypothetical protein
VPRKWNYRLTPKRNVDQKQARPGSIEKQPATYRESALAEDDDVHVQRFEVCLTVRVLVERSETDQVVVSEQFNLFTRLFQQDIFGGQGMYAKDLRCGGKSGVSTMGIGIACDTKQ